MITEFSIAEEPISGIGGIYRPLLVLPGWSILIDLRWLAKRWPQVFINPPDPETGRLDDPTPLVHDTSRY
jgi:hypothetical protein